MSPESPSAPDECATLAAKPGSQGCGGKDGARLVHCRVVPGTTQDARQVRSGDLAMQPAALVHGPRPGRLGPNSVPPPPPRIGAGRSNSHNGRIEAESSASGKVARSQERLGRRTSHIKTR